MKSSASIIAAGLLATVALAQPHAHHHHGHLHRKRHQEKRAVVTNLVYETVYHTVTVLIDESTTQVLSPTSAPASTTSSSLTSVTVSPGIFLEDTSSTEVESSTTSTSSEVVETPTPVVQLPPPPPPSVETPKVVPTPTPTPTPQPPVETPNPVDNGNSGGGAPASSHNGDLTYYAVGLGACGYDDTGKDHSENIVAVSHLLMGTQSNGNPYCGKTITVSNGVKTVQATVRDKCMGCAMEAIDGTEKMFVELFGSLDVGRGTVKWWFN
ncbi:putative allergen asp f7 protein [Cladorrhinum samala]|uniref:Allergen asp f7 protein n=1 Tax=Cladorrhinum samala TaxID=585594 RepID=A0AAV9HSW5_9PEZI|nr:putative allergen asp f7 protein [Cladorrhinum samala]